MPSGRVKSPLPSVALMLGVPVTDSVSPSGSVWPAVKSVTKDSSSSVFVSVIATVTGASLTPVIVMVAVFCVVVVPSETS